MSKERKSGNLSARLTIDPLNKAEQKLTALANDLGEESRSRT
jgi:hypothetical protein